ncbi:type II toxin-antitoxin system prevent-host-death family antitoxin [Candidatus Microgenomates bacterium]|nr:type II toxin-antitoxin system prevent-host-death family antitoxin [Candidatus Microgenomates bacterium]
MHKINISATELKNRVSEILNEVYYRGNEAVVERYGKPIAKIVPADFERPTRNPKDIEKALNATFGIMPDFPDVTKFRRSRRKKFSL